MQKKRTTATLNLSTASSLGTFDPNEMVIQPNEDSHWLTFTPAVGFTGGVVPTYFTVHFTEREFCTQDATVTLPNCTNQRMAIATKENTLQVVPNPATNSTTVIYSYEGTGSKGNKTIVLTDMLGRTLQTWNVVKPMGDLEIEVGQYESGQYMVLMKNNNTVIENTKLIINK